MDRTDADGDPELARLYWQCRRGMRELDLMLGAWYDAAAGTLGGAERAAFGRLLEYPDALLLEYLMGRSLPGDRELADVVRRIREVAVD
jgi:antitoxin CptB